MFQSWREEPHSEESKTLQPKPTRIDIDQVNLCDGISFDEFWDSESLAAALSKNGFEKCIVRLLTATKPTLVPHSTCKALFQRYYRTSSPKDINLSLLGEGFRLPTGSSDYLKDITTLFDSQAVAKEMPSLSVNDFVRLFSEGLSVILGQSKMGHLRQLLLDGTKMIAFMCGMFVDLSESGLRTAAVKEWASTEWRATLAKALLLSVDADYTHFPDQLKDRIQEMATGGAEINFQDLMQWANSLTSKAARSYIYQGSRKRTRETDPVKAFPYQHPTLFQTMLEPTTEKTASEKFPAKLPTLSRLSKLPHALRKELLFTDDNYLQKLTFGIPQRKKYTEADIVDLPQGATRNFLDKIYREWEGKTETEKFQLDAQSRQTNGCSYLDFQHSLILDNQFDLAAKLNTTFDDWSQLLEFSEVSPIKQSINSSTKQNPVYVNKPLGVRNTIFKDEQTYLRIYDANTDHRKRPSKFVKHLKRNITQFHSEKKNFDSFDKYLLNLLEYNLVELDESMDVIGRRTAKLLSSPNVHGQKEIRLLARFHRQLKDLLKLFEYLEMHGQKDNSSEKLRKIISILRKTTPFDSDWNQEKTDDHVMLKMFKASVLKPKIAKPTPITAQSLVETDTGELA